MTGHEFTQEQAAKALDQAKAATLRGDYKRADELTKLAHFLLARLESPSAPSPAIPVFRTE